MITWLKRHHLIHTWDLWGEPKDYRRYIRGGHYDCLGQERTCTVCAVNQFRWLCHE